MGIFVFDTDGHIVAFEEKPKADRLAAIGRSVPEGATFTSYSDDRPFMASMGIYVFSRQVLLDLIEDEPGHDFGRELIPRAMTRYNVQPYIFDGYWADVGNIGSFYEATWRWGCRTRRSATGTRRGRSTRTCATCPARGCSTARCGIRFWPKDAICGG
jgi:ADP-glucose pyrophosphorylase